MPKFSISHHAPVLPVSDLANSLRWYDTILHIKPAFKWQDPPTYAVMKYGNEQSFHLSQTDRQDIEIHQNMIYFFVEGIQSMYDAMQSMSVRFSMAIEEMEYGMIEFEILDPDGHKLIFGESTERQ